MIKGIQFFGIVFFLFFGSSLAQNKSVLYDFNEIPQSLQFNPGESVPFSWFAGVPGISGVSVGVGFTGAQVNDLFANDGVDFTSKVRDRLINRLQPNDFLNGTVQLEGFFGGFRGKNNPDNFYSFGAYLEVDMITYWPKDVAILGFQGNAGINGSAFNLAHLKARGDAVSVYHIGLNKSLKNGWTMGARAKLYSGIVNFTSTHNSGRLVTSSGQNNSIRTSIVADMQLQTSGFGWLFNEGDLSDNSFKKRALFGGDLGIGFDVGFTKQLTPQWVVTASLLDVGFISHSKAVNTYSLRGSATTEGIEIRVPDDLSTALTAWEGVVENIEELVPFAEDAESYVSFRPAKMYASVRYNFGQPKGNGAVVDCDCRAKGNQQSSVFEYTSAVGGQLYMIQRPRGPQAAITGFFQHRLGNNFSVKGTLTADAYTATNIGLGMSLKTGPLQFYAMADNLLGYRDLSKSQYASLQVGVNVLSW